MFSCFLVDESEEMNTQFRSAILTLNCFGFITQNIMYYQENALSTPNILVCYFNHPKLTENSLKRVIFFKLALFSTNYTSIL